MYGLLHDIGKLVILKAAYDVRRQTGAPIPEDVLDEVMREMHPHVGARRAAPVAPAEHARRAHRLPSRLAAGDGRAEEGRDHLLRQSPEPPLRLRLREGDGGSAGRSRSARYLNVDAAWLEQTDKHAPGLFEVAKKILG